MKQEKAISAVNESFLLLVGDLAETVYQIKDITRSGRWFLLADDSDCVKSKKET